MTNKGDLISRSALKEEMVRGCRRIGEAMGVVLPTLAFVNIIENAPTVEPEITEKQAILLLINNGWLVNHDKELREKWARPHGKWIPNGDCSYCCSNCRAWDYYDYQEETCPNYCPNCGAYMKGEDDATT